MKTPAVLPIEDILSAPTSPTQGRTIGQTIGRSREGRPLRGYVFGSGPLKASLIAGCHADEPVGPQTLEALVAFLAGLSTESPWLRAISWRIVPHVNPDGRLRNQAWSVDTTAVSDHRGDPGRGYAIASYLQHVTRELPGDDIEFGFPRHDSDIGARPENRSVAEFLGAGGPYHLHGSLHGMGFAPGPWFLIEEAWIGRSLPLRDGLRQRVESMGYQLFDPDRKGEKGFWRIDEGFSTRPDSAAMRRFFDDRGETQMSARFRPSSMEYIRSLGGDPFTFVSEMPLFLIPGEMAGRRAGSEDLRALRARLDEGLEAGADLEARVRQEAITPMPIRDQQRLQLAFLEAAMGIVAQ